MNKVVRVRIHRFFNILKYMNKSEEDSLLYEVERDAFLKEKDYQELRVLYDEFLEDIANVVKEYGIKNEYEVIRMFYILVNSGIFSKDLSFTHESPELKYHFTPLLGARIMSGYAVCKNCSFLAYDFATHFNFSAPPLGGNVVIKDDEGNIVDSGPHSLTILSVNGKKMLCDINRNYLFSSVASIGKSTEGDSVFTADIEFNLKIASDMLSLPNITKEEFTKLDFAFYKKFENEELRQKLFLDLYKVHFASRDKLKRICEIEESYSLPDNGKPIKRLKNKTA